jgi:DNA-binding transcriptional LysR family regulator
MELRHLRYFVAVAEALHISRAAEKLHVAQPAVSEQIRKLERDLGVELLDRTRRRIALTDAGAAFLAEARRVLEDAQQARLAARSAQEREASRVRIRYAPAALPAIVPRALQRLASGMPRLEASMHEGAPLELIDEVRAGRLDAAIVSLPAPTAGLRVTPLGKQRAVAAVPMRHSLNGFNVVNSEMAAGTAHDGLFPRPLRRRVRGLPAPALVLNAILATALIAFDATGDPLALFTTLALLSTFVYVFGYVLSVAAELCHSLARRTRGGRCDRPRHDVLGVDGGRDGRRGRAARHGVDPDRHPGLRGHSKDELERAQWCPVLRLDVSTVDRAILVVYSREPCGQAPRGALSPLSIASSTVKR